MQNDNHLLKNVLPDLADKIKQVFLKHNRSDLWEQVDKLEIVSLCDCGESCCGSFYTMTPPNEEDEYEVEGFVITNGEATVEIYNGKVGYVEIFPSQYGHEIHNVLNCLNKDTV